MLYALTTESERPILDVLDSHQRSRLEQLQLQADGPAAFMRPEIQDRLRMSPEQADAIRMIYERGRQEMAQSATLPPGVTPVPRGLTLEKRLELLKSKDFGTQVENVRTQVITTRNAIMREIAENLNKKQRATYLKMLGEKLEFPNTMEKQELGDSKSSGTKSSGRRPNQGR